MTSEEKINLLLEGKSPDNNGFWLGNPTDETKEMYYEHFNITSDLSEQKSDEDSVLLTKKTGKADLELALKLKSDIMWLSPELDNNTWQHPEGKPMFDVLGGKPRESLTQPGVFANCEDYKEVLNFDWPDPEYLDFSSTLKKIKQAKEHDFAVFGGMWMQFFHILCDFFGMENYFIKMHEQPKVVEAATEKVLDFYLKANELCLEEMSQYLDAQFFGNDLGSQLNLLISPKSFKRFILPGIKKIVQQAKKFDLKVVFHSCGAVADIIPMLIDAGVDGLHPLQAKASGMNIEELYKYKDDLLFIGGIDTQELLPFGSPEEIKAIVYKIKEMFGSKFIISPSHEALLPNVSVENVIAMKEAALQ